MSDDPHLFQSVVSVLGSDSPFIVTVGELHCDGVRRASRTSIRPRPAMTTGRRGVQVTAGSWTH